MPDLEKALAQLQNKLERQEQSVKDTRAMIEALLRLKESEKKKLTLSKT